MHVCTPKDLSYAGYAQFYNSFVVAGGFHEPVNSIYWYHPRTGEWHDFGFSLQSPVKSLYGYSALVVSDEPYRCINTMGCFEVNEPWLIVI